MASTTLTTQPAELLDCPVDQAVYGMKVAPEFTAGFARQDPRKAERYDLVFWLKTPRRTYFFSFHEPRLREGDYLHEGAYIVPDIDPKRAAKMGDYEVMEHHDWIRRAEPMAFDTFSPELYAWRVPHSGNPAPPLIFARGIGPLLWSEPSLLAPGELRVEQEEMPLGIFELVGCDPAPH
jgi:hypothetical protein